MRKVFVSMLICFGFAAAAQSAPVEASPVWEKVTFWVGFFLAAYEMAVRFFPTVQSYSILTLIVRILNSVVPDRRAKPVERVLEKF